MKILIHLTLPALLGGVLFFAVALAQEETAGYNFQSALARAAYAEGDKAAFLEYCRKAYEARPDIPVGQYNLACGYALNGQKEAALRLLRQLAEAGIDFGMSADPDLESIRGGEEFAAIKRALEKIQKPINHSTIAFKIAEKDLIPEGIAVDSATGIFYIGSVYKRKIIKVLPDGRVADFIPAGNPFIFSVLGLRIDPHRRVLWACTAAGRQMQGFNDSLYGRTNVFKFSLDGGIVLARYELPCYTPPVTLNDLVINGAGDAYITESDSGGIYFIHHDSNTMKLFLPRGKISGANGISFSDDEKVLYVAGYGDALYAVDPGTAAYERILSSDNVFTCGIDGLYFYDNSLVAVQNMFLPHRIARFYLNDTRDSVARFEIIERGHELFDEPTTGAIYKGEFYYIATSQLGKYYRDGTLFPPDSLSEVIIMKAPL